MRKVYMMCGLPGSGKSTWVKNKVSEYRKNGKKIVVISKDSLREMFHGYEYIFDIEYEPFICRQVDTMLEQALEDEQFDIIIDETHLTKSIRSIPIFLIGQHNSPIAKILVWCTENKNNVAYRIRDTKSNKITVSDWMDIIYKHKKIFQEPSIDEGFDSIIIHSIKDN